MKIKQLSLAVAITLLAISCSKQDTFTPQPNDVKSESTTTSVTSSIGTSSESSNVAYVFIEPKNKQTLIVKYLKDSVPHAQIPFLGFNFGFGITPSNKNDLLNYINLKYWYNGQLPAVRTVNVSQSTYLIDSLSINNLTINDNATWITILIPVSAMNNDTKRLRTAYSYEKNATTGALIRNGSVAGFTYTMNNVIFNHVINYQGNRLPKGLYRLYSTYPSPGLRAILNNKNDFYLQGKSAQ
jgi:hypothetical protein